MKYGFSSALLSTALLLSGCGDSISNSARNGFPGMRGGPLGDCDTVEWIIPKESFEGRGYFFGDIVSMEPVLDGVRQNTHTPDVYLGDTYECSDYGLAALRMTFKNVQASWDHELRDLVVLVDSLSLSFLDTHPVIDPQTHKLLWGTRDGSRATFPGKGTRIGIPVRGSQGGVFIGSFANLLEVHRDGSLTLRYVGECTAYDPDEHLTETSVLARARALEDADVIDFSEDLRWYATSICEYP